MLADELSGDVPLIVKLGNDDVVLAVDRLLEHHVAGNGAIDVDPFRARFSDCRLDVVVVLRAIETALAAMRVEAAIAAELRPLRGKR